MMDDINIDNIKENLERVVLELNIINTFCIKNKISFNISCKYTILNSSHIFEWFRGFELTDVKQTTIKEL